MTSSPTVYKNLRSGIPKHPSLETFSPVVLTTRTAHPWEPELSSFLPPIRDEDPHFLRPSFSFSSPLSVFARLRRRAQSSRYSRRIRPSSRKNILLGLPMGKLSLVTDRVLILLSEASLVEGDAVESLPDSSSGSTSSVKRREACRKHRNKYRDSSLIVVDYLKSHQPQKPRFSSFENNIGHTDGRTDATSCRDA